MIVSGTSARSGAGTEPVALSRSDVRVRLGGRQPRLGGGFVDTTTMDVDQVYARTLFGEGQIRMLETIAQEHGVDIPEGAYGDVATVQGLVGFVARHG